jgi:hypothetical protein
MEALRPLSGQRVQRQDLGAADMIDAVSERSRMYEVVETN